MQIKDFKKTTVALYSGGLDSFIMSYLFKPQVNLFIDSCSRYSKKELRNLEKPKHGELIIEKKAINLSAWERKDLIVPNRNTFFVLLAANYGNRILLGATAGDRSRDKDFYFCSAMNKLLNHTLGKQHWTEGSQYSVELPIKHYCKSELVEMYLQAGGDGNVLKNIVSCYHPKEKNCGRCKACARKWVALQSNGIHAKFKTDPANYFKPYIKQIKAKKYRGKIEDQYIERALGL